MSGRSTQTSIPSVSKRWSTAGSASQALIPVAIFVLFLAVPLCLLLPLAFNPPKVGVSKITGNFSLENLLVFFEYPLYWASATNSITLALLAVLSCLVLGYPIAHVIARAASPRTETALTFLVLVSMQLGIIERLYGLSILLGDNGLINQLIRMVTGGEGVPLMYNKFGIVVGLVQLSLPFMIMSLIGIIQAQPRSLEESARSLGASPWFTFWAIEVPLARHGILNGSLLVFAISVSSYVVPAVMGGSSVPTLPDNIFQQINGSSIWQLAAFMALALLLVSFGFIALHAAFSRQRLTSRKRPRA